MKAFTLLLLLPVTVLGGDYSLVTGGWSHHYISGSYMDGGALRDYNESHDRIAIRRTDNQDYTEVGTFVNSYYKRSWYAMKGVNVWWEDNWYAGFAGGVSSGYLHTEAKSVVFAAATAGFTVFDTVSLDTMLGWGQVNVGLRWEL